MSNNQNSEYESIKEIVEKSFEESMAKSLLQTSAFIDQVLIEISSDEYKKENIVKSLVNLKFFIDASTFEYKVKSLIFQKEKIKKKEKEASKELESQKEK